LNLAWWANQECYTAPDKKINPNINEHGTLSNGGNIGHSLKNKLKVYTATK
jgi:hypothetical protein